MQLYLDANAHLPLSKPAIDAYVRFNDSRAGHGHAMAMSAPGRDASSEIEKARTKIASLLGIKSAKQIVFTSTCTQACEWAFKIVSNNLPGKNVFMSTMEHPSVRISARSQIPGIIDLIPNKEGVISNAVRFEKTDAVICVHVQNEIGTIQPITDWHPGLFFCDISQSVGKLPIDLSRMSNIDIAVFGSHKFGGPPSVGILYLKDPNMWEEFGYGSRYYFDRSGTPDGASIVSAAAALEHAIKSLSGRYSNMLEFRDVFELGLSDMGWKVIGNGGQRIPNTSFFRVPKGMARHLLAQLSSEGIYVGLGSACGSNHRGPSPLMGSLGYGGGANDYMRVSQFGEYGVREARVLLAKLRRYAPSKVGEIP